MLNINVEAYPRRLCIFTTFSLWKARCEWRISAPIQWTFGYFIQTCHYAFFVAIGKLSIDNIISFGVPVHV
ncbi:hypothetical protein Fmac_009111 [Flemingia macrophylla]|uniref:Uncharacterized protein n=1 Tax=Flemingia macrophylla TaxID=520843 RepID=A0ABD1MZA8_9FABA